MSMRKQISLSIGNEYWIEGRPGVGVDIQEWWHIIRKNHFLIPQLN